MILGSCFQNGHLSTSPDWSWTGSLPERVPALKGKEIQWVLWQSCVCCPFSAVGIVPGFNQWTYLFYLQIQQTCVCSHLWKKKTTFLYFFIFLKSIRYESKLSSFGRASLAPYKPSWQTVQHFSAECSTCVTATFCCQEAPSNATVCH